ncbi:hypothetical protein DFH27DRAFT_327691 [Peziza echinospora]|nr:hypothetical protein DFH27DRAFT_327691 [Peziza echinospora]
MMARPSSTTNSSSSGMPSVASQYGAEDDDMDFIPKASRGHSRGSNSSSYGIARADSRGAGMHSGGGGRRQPSPNHSRPLGAGAGGAVTARRRIPVACGRCRKRKIRCTGDMDGQGCEACKTAKTAPGSCMFLRVQCEMRDLLSNHDQLLIMREGFKQAGSSNIDELNFSPAVGVQQQQQGPTAVMALGGYEAAHQQHHHHHHHHQGHGQQQQQHHQHQQHHHHGQQQQQQQTQHRGSANGSMARASQSAAAAAALGGYQHNAGDMHMAGHEGEGSMYDGGYPAYTMGLPGIGHNLMGSSGSPGMVQWTAPMSAAAAGNGSHRGGGGGGGGAPASTSVYMDQDAGGAPYMAGQRLSPHSVDAYGTVPPANIFPALTHLSENIPAQAQAGGYSTPKQLDKVILPAPQVFARSQSMDMGALGNRSTQMSAAAVTDPSLLNGYSYKNYQWGSEAPVAPAYTFSHQKTLPSSAYSTGHDLARNVSPLLQPAGSTLASQGLVPSSHLRQSPSQISSSTSSPSASMYAASSGIYGQTMGYGASPSSYSIASSAASMSASISILPSHSSTVLNTVPSTVSSEAHHHNHNHNHSHHQHNSSTHNNNNNNMTYHHQHQHHDTRRDSSDSLKAAATAVSGLSSSSSGRSSVPPSSPYSSASPTSVSSLYGASTTSTTTRSQPQTPLMPATASGRHAAVGGDGKSLGTHFV